MLFVVDVQVLLMLVELYSLVFIQHLLDMIGVLELLYHLNCTHYILRGGASSDGSSCGAFYVGASTSFSYGHWAIGAALSFKPSTHYTQRGGASLLSAYCGSFLVDVGDTASYAYWIAGADLE